MEKIEIIHNEVFLILPDCIYKPRRNIGHIENNVFYTYKSYNHKYNFYESIGICYKFLRYSPENLFSLICIDYNNSQLWTSRLSFLHFGKMINYKSNGLEKQLQLKLNQFHKTRAEAEEELRTLGLKTGLDFKRKISEKFLNLSNAMHSIKKGGLFN
jgi:hypothetical protein